MWSRPVHDGPRTVGVEPRLPCASAIDVVKRVVCGFSQDSYVQTFETAETFELPDERVWVVGDLHGNNGWIQTLLPAMRRHDPTLRTVLQLGDYGFDHSRPGKHTVDFWAKQAGIERMLVTLGNHEEWNHIAPAQNAAPGQAIRVSDVVWLLPRPCRFTIGDREILSLGGASSVDKHLRIPGRDWFADELLTRGMEGNAVAGGRADLLLTHESPVHTVPEVQVIFKENPDGYPVDALELSADQRARVQRVSDAVQPSLHMHGHMHVYGEHQHENGARVVSLGRDTKTGNAGVLDMKTLRFTPLSHTKIN